MIALGSNPAKQHRTAILLLTLAATCQFVDRAIVGVVLEPLRTEFALSDFMLGLTVGAAFSIPYALAVLPMGSLVERVDRIRLVTLLLAIWSVATAICGWATSIATFIVMRAIVGFAEAGASPAAMSLISSWAPPERRGTAISIFLLASAGGTIITFAGGGYLVAHYGWRTTFIVAGLVGMTLAVVMRLSLHDPANRSAAHARVASRAEATLRMLWRLFRRPALCHLALGSAMATALMVGLWAWAASFFVRIHHVDLQTAGLIVAAGAGLFAGGGTIVAGMASDRLGSGAASLKIPLVSLPLATAACLLLAATGSLPIAVAIFLIGSVFAPMFLAPAYTLILSLVEPDERGIVLAGVQMATSVLGSALGPATVGIVAGISGSLNVALVALAVTGPWAIFHFLRARHWMMKLVP